MVTSAVVRQKPKPEAAPFRSVIGRPPRIKPHGDIVTSADRDDVTSIEAGTVIAAGKFKATCLKLLDAAEKGASITITKRGKVVARLLPPDAAEEKPFVPLLGLMRGKGKILGDIVSPDFEAWGMEDPRKAKKKKK